LLQALVDHPYFQVSIFDEEEDPLLLSYCEETGIYIDEHGK